MFAPHKLPQCVIVTSVLLLFACNSQPVADNTPPPLPQPSGMCKLKDLGEASDLATAPRIASNQYCTVQGMSSPKTLVWRDAQTLKVYYATKLMGAGGRLFYMQEIATGETPAVREEFTGTILNWVHIERNLAQSMQLQFRKQWNVDIIPEETYIIVGNVKPKGCQ